MTKAELEWHRVMTVTVAMLLQREAGTWNPNADRRLIEDAMAALEEEQAEPRGLTAAEAQEPLFSVKGVSEEIRQGMLEQADGAPGLGEIDWDAARHIMRDQAEEL